MANIKEAFEYASRNPNGDFANSLKQLASSGALDVEAQKNGIDLSPFKQVEEPKQPSYLSRVGTDIKQGLQEAGQKIVGKEATPFSATIGAANSLLNAVASPITEATLAKSPSGKVTTVGQGMETGINKLGEFFQSNLTDQQRMEIAKIDPELYGKITSVLQGISETGNVAGAVAGATKVPKQVSNIKAGVSGAVDTVKSKTSQIIENKTKKVLSDQELLDLTSDNLKKEQRIQAIKEGRGVSETTFSKGALQASERELQRLPLIKDVIKSKDLNTNISNASSEIKHISENVLDPFLSENPYPYNPSDLTNYLKLRVKPSASIKLDKKASAIYNDIIKKGESLAMKEPPTTKGILNARKKLDQYIKKEYGDTVYEGEQKTALKSAPIKIRNAYNDFIKDSLKYQGNIAEINKISDLLQQAQARGIKIDSIPVAKQYLEEQFGVSPALENELKAGFFDYQLKKQHALFEAIDNMATKQEAKMGMSKAEQGIKKFKSNNPIKTRVANSAVKATVVGNLIQ